MGRRAPAAGVAPVLQEKKPKKNFKNRLTTPRGCDIMGAQYERRRTRRRSIKDDIQVSDSGRSSAAFARIARRRGSAGGGVGARSGEKEEERRRVRTARAGALGGNVENTPKAAQRGD